MSYKEFEILGLALDYGYFENPKRIKLEELAKMLDISKATASDLLRRTLKKSLKSLNLNSELRLELLFHLQLLH